MINEDIIRMAREAGLQAIYSACDEPNIRYAYENFDDELERFANLVAAAEREECAKRLDAIGCDHCATNIRLRGKE